MDVITSRNNFFGVGPRVGFSPQILLPAGFSICGEMSASGLLGRFYVKQDEEYLNQELYRHSDVMARFRFILDAQAYISWQKELLYKAFIVSVQLGWNWHKFYDKNQLHQNSYQSSDHRNNLFLEGGFLSLCAAF